MRICINGREIGSGHPPYIVAELSANHNGSIERAFKSIKAAHISGADAVKIQTYTADTMTIDCDTEDFMIRGGLWDGYKLFDLYKWAETPFEWHKAMFDYAASIGITLFSTPFDESAVDLLESLNAPAYKIASIHSSMEFFQTDLHSTKHIFSLSGGRGFEPCRGQGTCIPTTRTAVRTAMPWPRQAGVESKAKI